VSSESSCAVRLARHSQNAWARHVKCVESSRVESSQVEFELYYLNWVEATYTEWYGPFCLCGIFFFLLFYITSWNEIETKWRKWWIAYSATTMSRDPVATHS